MIYHYIYYIFLIYKIYDYSNMIVFFSKLVYNISYYSLSIPYYYFLSQNKIQSSKGPELIVNDWEIV